MPEDPARGRDECQGFNSVPLFQILGSIAKGVLEGRWKGCFETLFRSFHSLVQNSPMDLQLIQTKPKALQDSLSLTPNLISHHFPPFSLHSNHTGFLAIPLTHSACYSLKAFVLAVTAFWLSLPLGRCMADCLPSIDTITLPILTLQPSATLFCFWFFLVITFISTWHRFVYCLPALECKLHERRTFSIYSLYRTMSST